MLETGFALPVCLNDLILRDKISSPCESVWNVHVFCFVIVCTCACMLSCARACLSNTYVQILHFIVLKCRPDMTGSWAYYNTLLNIVIVQFKDRK